MPGFQLCRILVAHVHWRESSTNRSIQKLNKLCGDGLLDKALDIAQILSEQCFPLNRNHAYCILQTCEKRKDIQSGKKVQSLMTHGGIDAIAVLGDHLIRLFSYHGSLVEANQTFGRILMPGAYTRSAIILANAKLGHSLEALELYNKMQLSYMEHDKHIFLPVLKACTTRKALFLGRSIHHMILQNELRSDTFIGNALINMYAKCGSLAEAGNVLDGLQNRDVVSWNAMIAGYAEHGELSLALDCLKKMQEEGIMPNVYSWGAVLEGAAQQGEAFLTFECFEKMQEEGIQPNLVTFLSVLKACTSIMAIEEGRLIHDKILKSGMHSDILIGSTLIDMYGKSGGLEEACKVFSKLPHLDLVSWNAMIEAYVQNDKAIVALGYFEIMQQSRLKPNEVTFSSVLKACTKIGAIQHARHVHEQFLNCGRQSDIVAITLIDMYAKSGRLEEAHTIFDKLRVQNVVSWNSLVTGYAQHGEGLSALQCFEKMQQRGLSPNEVSCLSILTACSRAGLVDEGHWYFSSMAEYHEIVPTNLHSSCMVDLLGRAGCLVDAKYFLHRAFHSGFLGWMSLLTACRMHGNVEVGKDSFDQVVCLDPNCTAAYVIMANIYADAHMVEEVGKIEKLKFGSCNMMNKRDFVETCQDHMCYSCENVSNLYQFGLTFGMHEPYSC